MNQPGLPADISQPCILVAPLDWGLGHATRCIPIIKELIAQGNRVLIASDGGQASLLQKDFPHLTILPLPGYKISYSKSRGGLFWKLVLQIPKILSAIRHENKWLINTAIQHRIDAVISDNRYGLFSEKIPCIFITHQLSIKTSLGKWADTTLRKWNYKFINKFAQCWVPDEEGDNNLAGELSHPDKLPVVPLKYIGVLSRFHSLIPFDVTGKFQDKVKNKYILFLVSGPEPQRTQWENKILRDLKSFIGSAIVVRGLPGSNESLPAFNDVHLFNHMPSEQLNDAMGNAEWVISRCGYSTVMDIAKLGKKAILIPTPGQSEQEYLAMYLMKNHIAFCVNEKEFSLKDSLDQAMKFSYKPILFNDDKLKITISEFKKSMH